MNSVLTLLLLGLGVGLFRGQHDRSTRVRFLRLSGLWLMAAVSVFVALFAVGETLGDPGGWAAIGLIALWALPMGGLCALAVLRPDRATHVLSVAVAAVVGASVWSTLAPGAWRAVEDQHGPVRAVAVWVVAAASALLGLKRTRAAGLLLVVVGAVPSVLGAVGDPGFGSLAAVSAPPVLSGVLYLLSAALDTPAAADQPRPPPTEVPAAR